MQQTKATILIEPQARLNRLADDMRPALGIIVAYAALLGNQRAGSLNARQAQYVERIRLAAKALARHLEAVEYPTRAGSLPDGPDD
jgi:hypothetical protein